MNESLLTSSSAPKGFHISCFGLFRCVFDADVGNQPPRPPVTTRSWDDDGAVNDDGGVNDDGALDYLYDDSVYLDYIAGENDGFVDDDGAVGDDIGEQGLFQF